MKPGKTFAFFAASFARQILAIAVIVTVSGCPSANDPFIDDADPASNGDDPIQLPTISHGRELTARNTGVPSGHTLTDVTSTITVTESWIANSNGGSRILEERNFINGANLIISADDFTVRYCKFNGTSSLSMLDLNTGEKGTNGKVYYCEFDGKHENGTDEVAIYGSSVYLRGVHVHAWPRGMWIGDGNVTVEECYFHDITADGSGAHIENIYVAGGANMSFVRNKFISNEIKINGDTSLMTSGSLAIYNEGSPFPDLDNILVKDNYFESDGYFTLYCGALSGKDGAYAKNEVITGNVFGRTTGMGGTACAFDENQAGNEWSDNFWGPKGSSTPESEPDEGIPIAAPSVF